MKKIILICVTLCITSLSLFSQKIDLKGLKVSYIQLPLKPFNDDIKTYQPDLIMKITDEKNELKNLKDQYLVIKGYDKSDEADITVSAKFGEFKAEKELITKDVYNVNAGKNMTGYHYKVTCVYPIQLTITKKDGQILFEESITHQDQLMTFDFGKWTYSANELENNFNAEKKEKLTDIKNKCDKNALSNIKKILISNFSYAPVKKNIKIAGGKAKKFNYSDLDKAKEHIQTAFDMISDKVKAEKYTEELNKAVSIWENALKESSESKKARINKEISSMLNYNLCIAFWWMHKFDEAIEYAEKALKLNGECQKPSSKYKKLILQTMEDIKDYKKRLNIHDKI